MCALAWAASTQAEEGFEQQCQNSMPQSFIEIEIRTAAPAVLHDRPLAEMIDTGADAAVAPQAAFSRTDLGWTGRVGLNGFKSEDGTVCATASFRIELALSTEVVIAREVFERPCLAELVLGHELEHVSISESNLRASADQLEQELGEAYASRRLVGRESALLQDLNRDVEERWEAAPAGPHRRRRRPPPGSGRKGQGEDILGLRWRVGASAWAPAWHQETIEYGTRGSRRAIMAESVLGFIGVGKMGGHMASRLLDAGHKLAIYDTSEAALAPLVARGAQRASLRQRLPLPPRRCWSACRHQQSCVRLPSGKTASSPARGSRRSPISPRPDRGWRSK